MPRQWWVVLVNSETGEVKGRPVFLVTTPLQSEAVRMVETNLCREEYPPVWVPEAQIVEFGEMGPDVAFL